MLDSALHAQRHPSCASIPALQRRLWGSYNRCVPVSYSHAAPRMSDACVAPDACLSSRARLLHQRYDASHGRCIFELGVHWGGFDHHLCFVAGRAPARPLILNVHRHLSTCGSPVATVLDGACLSRAHVPPTAHRGQRVGSICHGVASILLFVATETLCSFVEYLFLGGWPTILCKLS